MEKSQSQKVLRQIDFSEKEFALIQKASAVSSLGFITFVRSSAVENARDVLKTWGMLPLDFYTEKGGNVDE